MAHDILYNKDKYRYHYSDTDIVDFKKYLSKASNDDIYHRLLKMYVAPVHNKEKIE